IRNNLAIALAANGRAEEAAAISPEGMTAEQLRAVAQALTGQAPLLRAPPPVALGGGESRAPAPVAAPSTAAAARLAPFAPPAPQVVTLPAAAPPSPPAGPEVERADRVAPAARMRPEGPRIRRAMLDAPLPAPAPFPAEPAAAPSDPAAEPTAEAAAAAALLPAVPGGAAPTPTGAMLQRTALTHPLAADPAPALRGAGGYIAQFGAWRSEQRALIALRELQERSSALREDGRLHISPAVTPSGGQLWRIRTSTRLSLREGRQLCGWAREVRFDCFVARD
ncbi:MAG: hypothetical protein NZN45_01195, partial [Rhodovarius sp.]|nr:hypothetical protein [Rhodovarius sp.]